MLSFCSKAATLFNKRLFPTITKERILKQEKDIHSEDLYLEDVETIIAMRTKYLEYMHDFNLTRPSEIEKRIELLKKMFASFGDGSWVEPPFHANWGGHHVHFGKSVYANVNLMCVDDTHIYVGDNTMFGPNVTLVTAGHPILPSLRNVHPLQYNVPVHIGKNCWLGSNVVVLPGVSIGDNSVVAAGSIVTKNLPANIIAAGSPARVLRPINDRDKEFYFQDRKINPKWLSKIKGE